MSKLRRFSRLLSFSQVYKKYTFWNYWNLLRISMDAELFMLRGVGKSIAWFLYHGVIVTLPITPWYKNNPHNLRNNEKKHGVRRVFWKRKRVHMIVSIISNLRVWNLWLYSYYEYSHRFRARRFDTLRWQLWKNF